VSRRKDESATDKRDEPTQTTPKGAIIPIPTRGQIAGGLKKLAKPIVKPSDDHRPEK
jgi:hypothetical protein